MHGLIFTSFRDYLAVVHGVAIKKEILKEAPVYLISNDYPDEQLVGLLDRAAALTGRERDALLREFGIFTAETTFPERYPALYAVSQSAREFVLMVEQPIHDVVRAAIPDARPPQLSISELVGDGVSIVYDSPRRLCVFLRGLVEGTARHYGEIARIEERTCMHRGDPACTFEIRFEPIA